MYKKLFIPGPTHVRDEILQAQTAPMLGHREKDYAALQGEVTPSCKNCSTPRSASISTPAPRPV